MPRVQAVEGPKGFYRPLITIRIALPSGASGRFLAMADTGADRSIVPAELLVAAGVPFESLTPDGHGIGAGGRFETRLCKAAVYFREWQFCDEIQVAEPGNLHTLLLGRADFFQTFVVRFLWQRNPPEMDIDPASPPATSGKKRKR